MQEKKQKERYTMNLVVLVGRLTKDPEVKTGQTTIAEYSLAVDKRFKREGQPKADFIHCVVFGKGAEFADEYLKKGMKIGVTGRIQTGSYTARDGSTRYTTDVIVDTQEFMTPKAENATERVREAPDGFEPMGDMELPFV